VKLPAGARLRVRIVGTELPGGTCGPHRGIWVGIQVGKEVLQVVPGDTPRASWEVEVSAIGTSTKRPALRGPAVQGRGDERFFYLTWLAIEGSARTMFRRAKLQLDAVPTGVLNEAVRRGVLVGALAMTDAGMPICASVRPPRITWSASDR
jgi:hypothetical protein